jgi:hypothetical protein
MIFYLAGCNLLNDFTRANAEMSVDQRGISGVWFSSNPQISLDSIKLLIGKKKLGFTHKEAESGISFTRDPLLVKAYQDSSLHVNLQLKGRHMLINSCITSMASGELMCYMNQDSLLVLTKSVSNYYCDGTKFEVLDNQNHLCLGVYLEDSNVIRIKGYFAGTKRTLFIGDNDIKVFSKVSPSYQSDCNSAAAELLPRHNFSKREMVQSKIIAE